MYKNQLPFAAIGLIFACFFSSAVAEGQGLTANKIIDVEQSLGLIRNVYLLIDDQVSEKCWTNTSQVKQKARLILEQSGIHVYDEPLFIISPFSTNLLISGLGQRAGNGACFGNIETLAFREVHTDFGDVSVKYLGVNYTKNSIAIASDNLNNLFLNAIDTYISQFASNVIAGRREPVVNEILAKRSTEKTKPVTMSEFRKMFEEAVIKK